MGNPLDDETNSDEEHMPDVLTEDEFESLVPIESSSGYYDKAQDFSALLKTIRLRYSGYQKKIAKDKEGQSFVTYIKRKGVRAEMTVEGIDFMIRFLESRLSRHTVLTNYDSKDDMFKVLKSDMMLWLEIVDNKMVEWKIQDESAKLSYFIDTLDALENAYRRAIGNQERAGMTPGSKETINRLARAMNLEIPEIPIGNQQVPQGQQRQTPNDPGY